MKRRNSKFKMKTLNRSNHFHLAMNVGTFSEFFFVCPPPFLHKYFLHLYHHVQCLKNCVEIQFNFMRKKIVEEKVLLFLFFL